MKHETRTQTTSKHTVTLSKEDILRLVREHHPTTNIPSSSSVSIAAIRFADPMYEVEATRFPEVEEIVIQWNRPE